MADMGRLLCVRLWSEQPEYLVHSNHTHVESFVVCIVGKMAQDVGMVSPLKLRLVLCCFICIAILHHKTYHKLLITCHTMLLYFPHSTMSGFHLCYVTMAVSQI